MSNLRIAISAYRAGRQVVGGVAGLEDDDPVALGEGAGDGEILRRGS